MINSLLKLNQLTYELNPLTIQKKRLIIKSVFFCPVVDLSPVGTYSSIDVYHLN